MSMVENTKELILEAACRLFSERGYDAVGVQELCEAVNVTKPTLYYYFGSKKGILKALVDLKGGKLLETLERACVDKGDFFASIMEILKAEIAFAKNNQMYFRLHCNLLRAPKNAEYFEVYEEMRDKLKKLFLDFFIASTAVFGNMRGKEQLYSTLFHNQVLALVEGVLSGEIRDNEKEIYTVTHSFIYGFAD